MAKREYDKVLGHADESDGIEEYDNPLPDWWVGLFLVTIVWGVIYAVDYHFVSHRSQLGYYEAEMAEAAVKWPVKEATVTLDPETIAAGREIFMTNCIGCHGPDLHGTQIAPNLVDSEWIHGGRPEDIVKTITEGVPAKGMVTWGPILGPAKISQVAAFVISSNEGGSQPAPAPE